MAKGIPTPPPQPSEDAIAADPPAEAEYHSATKADENCMSCRFFQTTPKARATKDTGPGICSKWQAYVRPDHVSNAFECLDEGEEENQGAAAADFGEGEKLAVALASGYAVAGKKHPSYENTLHPRWPPGAPAGLGGQYIESGQLIQAVEKFGRMNVGSLGKGLPNITGVTISNVSSQPRLLQMTVQMEHNGATASVVLYIEKKLLGIDKIQASLNRLSKGAAIRQLTSIKGMVLSASVRAYNPYNILARQIQGGGAVGLSEAPTALRLAEIFCDETELEEEDGLVWAPALVVGQMAMSPGQNGGKLNVPLRVVEGRSSDNSVIGLQDLVDSFEDGAVQHVTIPLTHADLPHENSGYIRKLRIGSTKDGKRALFAGHDFTEPDIKGRVQRGSIANRSVGVEFDYERTDTGKKYRQVLRHVALTNKPFFRGMTPYGVAAAEATGVLEPTEGILGFVSEDRLAPDWTTARSFGWRQKVVDAALASQGDFVLRDLDGDEALVQDDSGKLWLAPYTVDDTEASFHDSETWREIGTAPALSSDDDPSANPPAKPPLDNPDEAIGTDPDPGPGGTPQSPTPPGPEPQKSALEEARARRRAMLEEARFPTARTAGGR